MLKYLKKYWFWCILAPLFMVGEIIMDLLQPDMMATIVDDGVLGNDMDLILSVGIKMILLVMFGGFCGIMSGIFANLASKNFGNDLRKDLFSKIMNLSFQQTDKITTGSLVTRLSNDVQQVETMVMMSVRSVVRTSIMFLGGIFMLYRQGALFAAVAACAFPIIAVSVTFFLKKASPMFTVVQEKLDGVNNVMQENVAGARVVKAYVKEKYELDRFDKANGELCATNLRVSVLLSFMGPIMNIVANSCVVFILLLGGNAIKAGEAITPGQIMASITYIMLVLNGVMFMANIFQTFTRARASQLRIKEVLACDEVISDGPGDFAGLTESAEKGAVEFKSVSFSYPNSGGKAVLEDISLKVSPGETLAILGATGSGKTTLVNLIPRFYDVTGGEVLVDGRNVKDFALAELRDKIAVVLQKAELYSRTVEANIRWGNEKASKWDIKRAAETAQADDFICAMPEGYYTQVTEGGHSLSGGQKQRISIARAVIRDPEIMIFDDSTSALDLKTEANLYKELSRDYPDVTKIIIAQRIASVKGADRIAVIENGRICACGTHSELMETSGVYRDIYDSQLKEGDE